MEELLIGQADVNQPLPHQQQKRSTWRQQMLQRRHWAAQAITRLQSSGADDRVTCGQPRSDQVDQEPDSIGAVKAHRCYVPLCT